MQPQLCVVHGKLRAKYVRPLNSCFIFLLTLISLHVKCQLLDGEKS